MSQDRFRVTGLDYEPAMDDSSTRIEKHPYKTFETLKEAKNFMRNLYLTKRQRYFTLVDYERETYAGYDAMQEIVFKKVAFFTGVKEIIKTLKERS